ncbi:serine/threonine-protein kinase [Pseudoclavibacter sp. 8L]|uniref:serine/threonine-protein kinase n=1 Tax=Pseudoclavibacter sp. 8L TaxID=2653162 RepID=UPI00135B988C|nr:serine/threonine-protein kinase [Pseudoclavibacter sp. 8L]
MGAMVYPSGTTVNDRYELGDKLGSDGQVYQAYDRHLARTVALKLLDPTGQAPQSWDEARQLEQLRSRYIVQVLNADVVTSSDIRYITTPLLPDGDLEQEARPIGVSVATAVRYIRHIAAGVDTIHATGMIHRDIKPANSLRDGDNVMVSDVAMCVLLDEDGTAEPNGSYCTVAPEVLGKHGRCSVASDVYSLAATAFYLLSGEYHVDHRNTKAQQRDEILAGDIRDLSDFAPHVPRAVASIVRKGMSLAPSARHQSVEDFGNALATAASGRRDWRRVTHPGHVYCAEGPSPLEHSPAIGICARNSVPPQVVVRTFHLRSGRAVAGIAERQTSMPALSRTFRRAVADVG